MNGPFPPESGVGVEDRPLGHVEARLSIDEPVPVWLCTIVSALLTKSFLVVRHMETMPDSEVSDLKIC
jgi:hypothetical protein